MRHCRFLNSTCDIGTPPPYGLYSRAPFVTREKTGNRFFKWSQPHFLFDYNDIFLETTTFKQYDKLMRLQRRCLRRCLPENVKINRNDIYNTAGINRAESHLLKLMYNRAQNPLYRDNTQDRTRLHDGPVLIIPFPNNETFRKSIVFRGSTLWNNLPAETRYIPTFECFKSKMKKRLQEKLT